MTNTELIAAVAAKANVTKKDTKELVETIVSVVNETLIAGKEVKLAGLGKFEVVPTSARVGHNPQTGEAVQIPASKKIKFSVTKSLKDAVKNA